MCVFIFRGLTEVKYYMHVLLNLINLRLRLKNVLFIYYIYSCDRYNVWCVYYLLARAHERSNINMYSTSQMFGHFPHSLLLYFNYKLQFLKKDFISFRHTVQLNTIICVMHLPFNKTCWL